jgi:environmental stress-induced protein Ves
MRCGVVWCGQVRQFNDMIQDIEVKHREELQTISYKQQARTSHSSVLEKEMKGALV